MNDLTTTKYTCFSFALHNVKAVFTLKEKNCGMGNKPG